MNHGPGTPVDERCVRAEVTGHATLVGLTGNSSKQSALVTGLAASQPALLAGSTDRQQRPPVRQRQA